MNARRWLRLAVLVAVAATSLGMGQGTAQADPNPIEDSFADPDGGPWAVTWSEGQPGGTTDNCVNQQGDPVGDYTYVYPSAVGAFGDHPVIVWGNGTSITGEDGTCSYELWLRFLASWGYVVVAANSSSVGDGALLRWGGVTTANRNSNPSDFFYQKLDTSSIGVAGHSQGALGAVNAAIDQDGFFANVTSYSLPSRLWMTSLGFGSVMPTKAEMDDVDAPIFFVWGTNDPLANWFGDEPDTTIDDWAPPTGPFAAGAVVADHANPFSLSGPYSIAWNHYTLTCYAPAIPAFVSTGGNPPEITTNSGWQYELVQGLTTAC